MTLGLNTRNVLYLFLGLLYFLVLIILFVGAGLITKAVFDGSKNNLKLVGIEGENQINMCRFTMIITWILYVLIFFILPGYFIFVR